ncbi:hypothetical protein [Ramlibacter humi]|uniref:Uncharacterized protein n=1 Tax=Ramlibacter humi TaxID=2530451 RepID=A0A4Z0BCZ8_9BURK|nr:hypothetical protein [Ramlibacter humi]TFY96167.1 hypothetical protein EZ216_21115 [Ramlibacter humi]
MHGFRGGLPGWWWVADGFWYPWPYEVVVPAGAPVWFYCPGLGAYYPAVVSCPDGWMQVIPLDVTP